MSTIPNRMALTPVPLTRRQTLSFHFARTGPAGPAGFTPSRDRLAMRPAPRVTPEVASKEGNPTILAGPAGLPLAFPKTSR